VRTRHTKHTHSVSTKGLLSRTLALRRCTTCWRAAPHACWNAAMGVGVAPAFVSSVPSVCHHHQNFASDHGCAARGSVCTVGGLIKRAVSVGL